LILLGFLSGLAFIIGGLLGGLVKSDLFIGRFTIVLILFSVFFVVWNPFYQLYDLTATYTQWIKFSFFICFICISSISIFFLTVNFHSSLSYRILSLGNSPNRLFFQPILIFGAWISVPLYIYLFFQNSLDARILSVAGLILSFHILRLFYFLPKTKKEDPFELKEAKSGIINYRQTLGFYNLFLIYQLSQSFNTGGAISNLWMDLFLLALSAFFIINSLSSKVESIEDIEVEKKRKFKFRSQTFIFMRIKNRLGEKSLVFVALGISIGYIMVIIGSFLGYPLPFYPFELDDAVPLNVLYHRMYLFIALVLIFIAIVNSSFFSDLATNRYTIRHALRMFGDLFRQGMENSNVVMNEIFTSSKQKFTEIGDQLKKNAASLFKGLFKKPQNPTNDDDTKYDPEH
jgi:hypothetical protein